MQQRWEKESIFIHLAKDKDYTKNIELGFFNLFKKIKSSNKEDVFIFHAQSSLPYLISGWIAKKLLAKKSNFVYDIHDLHEWNNNDSMFSKNAVRFYVLDALERIAFKITAIKKITVSQGLSTTMATKYANQPPIIVRNISVTENINPPRIENRIDSAVIFFGTRERVPLSIISGLKKSDIELHLYGKDITKDWLKNYVSESDLSNVKIFGEYNPNDLAFLENYKVMILFAPENKTLNFRYSLPNKLFQALERGVVVIFSDNFEEISNLFSKSSSVISSDENEFIQNIEKILKNGIKENVEKNTIQIKFLYKESRESYLNVMKNSH